MQARGRSVRAHAQATSCLSACFPVALRMPRTPWTALTLPYSFFSLLWLSHSRDREPPSPPLVAVVATTVVTPHQSDQRLRLDAPDLSMELRNTGSPASLPTPSSPSPAARDRRRPLATSDVSPEPLGPPIDPL